MNCANVLSIKSATNDSLKLFKVQFTIRNQSKAPKGQSSNSDKGREILVTNFVMFTGKVDEPFVPFCNYLQNCAIN